MRTHWLLAVPVFAFPFDTPAVSFDCANAASRVEKLVCADNDLSALDDRLAAEYRAARRAGLSDFQVGAQRAWVAQRDACKDKKCIRERYESRIAELAGLGRIQPDSPEEESDSPEYVVRCDPPNGILSIHESGEEGVGRSAEESPRDVEVADHRISPDVLTRPGGTDEDPLLLPAGNEHFQCDLGKASYQITIDPYIFNGRVMGQCGAAPPIISAEVSRNGKVVLAKQRFGSCRGDSRVIHRIRFDERGRSMRVLATLDASFLPVRIEKVFRFSALPRDLETAVFETFPTGDVDVDLFIAVSRTNVEQVREALAGDATPNARDNNGFTPLAYLSKISAAPLAPGRSLEQEGRDAERIAKLLFAKGASGNVKNNEGVSVLDYLILGRAPPPVIDLVLQNGADPKTDRSLSHASWRGDPALVGKLLALGADPNGKGRDGSTALWSATNSGFYSWGEWPTPPIDEYARCVRLLLQHGARVDAAIGGSEGLPWFLVRSFWKDERLKPILAELIPYSSDTAIRNAYDLSARLDTSQEGAAFHAWFGQFVRP